MKGNNQVALYQSPTQYPGGIQIVVQGGPTAAFLLGGSPGTAASYTGGPYVARFEPLTGVGASSGTYTAPGHLNIMKVASCNGDTTAPAPGSLFYGSLTDCSTDYSKLKQPNTSPTALKVPFTP